MLRTPGWILATLLLSLVAGCDGGVPTGGAASVAAPGYSKTGSVKVPFGRPIQIPYILDAADVTGDGLADLAVGAKSAGVQAFTPEYEITTFLGVASPSGAFDLSPLTRTHRTWSGKFFWPVRSGPAYLAMTGNGEIGLPGENPGEPTTLWRLNVSGGAVVPQLVFRETTRGTSGNIDVCDTDRDGRAEMVVNNVAASFSPGRPDLVSRVFRVAPSGAVSEGNFRQLVPALYTGKGGVNQITLADVDADGDCDALFAFEAYKLGPHDTPLRGEAIRAQYYVIPNQGGTFSGRRIDIPNPPYGQNTSAHAIATTRVGGETLVALASSDFPSYDKGFSGFALQIFALRDGRFVEVTGDRLVGRIHNTESNQSYLRFSDIDGDGDADLWLTRYDKQAGIVVYLQDAGRFIATRINASGPSGQKAVAFLKTAGKACMDLAVLDETAQLYRFSCR